MELLTHIPLQTQGDWETKECSFTFSLHLRKQNLVVDKGLVNRSAHWSWSRMCCKTSCLATTFSWTKNTGCFLHPVKFFLCSPSIRWNGQNVPSNSLSFWKALSGPYSGKFIPENTFQNVYNTFRKFCSRKCFLGIYFMNSEKYVMEIFQKK